MSGTRFHSVTEVCRRLGLKPHVLRYWEEEFEMKVKRNSAGRRIYSTGQIEKLALVKHLVREERLTVKGAKRRIAHMSSPAGQPGSGKKGNLPPLWLRKELLAIRALLAPTDIDPT